MNTLDQIAASLRLTKNRLRQRVFKGGCEAQAMNAARRQFVLKAFAEGHGPVAICEFIARTPVMARHALRMSCLDAFGGPYERSWAEMAEVLRKVAA